MDYNFEEISTTLKEFYSTLEAGKHQI